MLKKIVNQQYKAAQCRMNMKYTKYCLFTQVTNQAV